MLLPSPRGLPPLEEAGLPRGDGVQYSISHLTPARDRLTAVDGGLTAVLAAPHSLAPSPLTASGVVAPQNSDQLLQSPNGDRAAVDAAEDQDGRRGHDEAAAAALTLPTVEPRMEVEQPWVLLFVLSLVAPAAFLLPANKVGSPLSFGALDEAPDASAGAQRKSAMRLAGSWLAAAAGPLKAAQSLLVGDSARGQRIVIAPTQIVPPRDAVVTTAAEAVIRRALSPPGTMLFFTLAALAGTALYDPASMALAKVNSLIRPAPALVGQGGLQFGAMTLRPVIPYTSIIDDGSGPNVATGLEQCRQADVALRAGLAAPPFETIALSPSELQFYHDSIDRVGACDLSELYSEDGLLQSKAPGLGAPDLALAPFSEVLQPPHTSYRDAPGVGASKPRRQPDHCFEPVFTSPVELLEPWCLSSFSEWLLELEADVVTIAEEDYEARATRPQPFVVGQDCFRPAARGCVWDLRRAREGIIEPLDYDAPLHSQLDVAYARKTLPDWPDQRLFSYLELGAHFEFDMPLQMVLHPHLFSVWHGFPSLQKEARRLQGTSYKTQWSELFAQVPFAPIWVLAHGATPRKLEPDRWRSTTEGGAPRKDTYDTEGVQVRSINDRSREYSHPPERKPAPAHMAQDVAVLNSGVASALRQCTSHSSSTERPPGHFFVYVGVDDVADYFMHLATAPELWWYSTYAVLAREDDPNLDVGSRLRFVGEYSLSFGIFCSSGHAQRFSMIIQALAEKELLLLLEEEWPDWRNDPCYGDWLSRRAVHLGGAHSRMHTTKMYTDDAALAAASLRMFMLLLLAWHRATVKLNLRMAVAAKRVLGTAVIWLGVGFVTAIGLLFIPRNKILRAVQALRQLRQAELEQQLLISLNGLLEHIRGVLFGPRHWMFGLWTLASDRRNPAARPQPDGFTTQVIVRWEQRLLSGGVANALSAFARRTVSSEEVARLELSRNVVTMSLHLWPDAARQRLVVDRRGLGGWCDGFVFSIHIPALGMELLAISILELLAALVSALTFAVLAPLLPLHLHTDSLTSYYVLADETGKAPEGQFALSQFHSLPEAKALRERLHVDHTYGEGNVGDLPSRGKWKELHALAAQLGTRVRHADVPQVALELVRDTLRYAGERQGVPNRELLKLCGDVHPHPGPSALERARLTLAAGVSAQGAPHLAVAAMAPPSSTAQTLPVASPSGSAAAARPLSAGERAAAILHLGQAARERVTASAQELKRPRVDVAARHIGSSSAAAPAASSSGAAVPLGSLVGNQRVTFEELQARRRRGTPEGTELGRGKYALRPSDEGLLARVSMEAHGLNLEAQNPRTLEKDMGHWNQYWEPICRLFNTESIRDAPGAATGSDVVAQECDIKLIVFAFILIMAVMQPKKKSSPAAQPRSGFQVLLGVRRVHMALGVTLVSLKYVRSTLRGLLLRFVRVHGHDALVPDRKWPIPHGLFVRLLRLTVVVFGSTRWTADSLFGKSTLAMICLLYASGFRKAEITCHSTELTYLTRSSLKWVIHGVGHLDPTEAILRSAGPGCYVEAWPRQSKCDITGEIWGGHATFHFWSPEEGNAFRALADLELARPVHGVERRLFPLFCENDGSPVSETRAARLLDAMLLMLVSSTMAYHYTWHSFRRSLATRLRKANCPPETIMQICRWQTLESLRTYALLDGSQQLKWHKACFNLAFQEGSDEEAQIDSAPALAQLDQDPTWDREEHGATAAAPATPARGGATPRSPHAPAPTQPLAPLTKDNAPRRLVLVPRARYPRNHCDEHNGAGWEAIVLSATGVTAMVRYLHARTADGRPYEDTREPLGALKPIN